MQHAEGDEPGFAVVEAVILKGKRQPIKHNRHCIKIKTMIGEIGAPLGFVPQELHLHSVHTLVCGSKGYVNFVNR